MSPYGVTRPQMSYISMHALYMLLCGGYLSISNVAVVQNAATLFAGNI